MCLAFEMAHLVIDHVYGDCLNGEHAENAFINHWCLRDVHTHIPQVKHRTFIIVRDMQNMASAALSLHYVRTY